MSKHTPGPWFSQYDDNGFYEIGSEAVTLRLAFTYGEGDTDEANARLIAAATDMYKALSGVATMTRCGQLDEFVGEPWLNAVFAALKKADGETE